MPSRPSGREGNAGSKRRADGAALRGCLFDVAALERSDNVANDGHAFAGLKRGYGRETVVVPETVTHPPLHCCLLRILCLLAAQLSPS